MNAKPTSNLNGGVQLLTRASFADLRGAKFFRCVRLVGAVGVENGERNFKDLREMRRSAKLLS
ncbi:MAG: hypothetical protein DMG49_15315 [Acidobacteria bacterium]|nr:MAG: hypothetical protein DMG49_15315 [Acidobacteriota bacterium]